MSRVQQLLLRGGSRLAGPLQSSSNNSILNRLEPFAKSRARPPRPASHGPHRTASTSTSSVSSERNEADIRPIASEPPNSGPSADGEKQKAKKPIRKVSEPKDQRASNSTLPLDLDVFWNCADWGPSSSSDLPPEDILKDSLNNLLICLHPQAQRRSLYSTASGSGPVEPTLALYCPIEGGDYLVDNTVRELARRTSSEVLVLDSVQLAAGEWGLFGDANPLELNSLLKFNPPVSSQGTNKRHFNEEDEEETDGFGFVSPQSMTIHVSGLIPASGRSTRQAVITPTQRNSLTSRRKVFFEEVVNLPAPISDTASENPLSIPETNRPRIIYIRDYHTLASSRHVWFGPLLSAVRARRQGPISRASSPVLNPTVIIYGITPPIIGPSAVPTTPLSSSNLHDGGVEHQWSESNFSHRARERRFRERLKRWKDGPFSIKDELPQSPSFGHLPEGMGPSDHPQLVVVPVNGGISGILGNMAASGQQFQGGPPTNEDGEYYRTSVIVPKVRQIPLEKASRIDRRLVINEIVMRMALGIVGGQVSEGERMFSPISDSEQTEGEQTTAHPMFTQWGEFLQEWTNMKLVADRAVGSAIASNPTLLHTSTSPTPVSWEDVCDAWEAQHSSAGIKQTWIEDTLGTKEGPRPLEEQPDQPTEQFDEVFDAIKHDSNLTVHERRLLGCFVSPSLMTTTFSQVHLPAHTIDSVRSIISLPLLHPQAFSRGVLKEHAMSGALLFGPPGTGKTLLARALAKESGARMMLIKPSDVMDMYVGEGEKLVRSVFTLARRLAPCVVFLDEIDALLGARVTSRDTGGAFAMRGVITEFMQEMDGLTTSQEQRVVVIGATNRPFDLDDAVLRRLPRRLLISLPDETARLGILKIILRDEHLADDVDLPRIAMQTEGFSGSDLKHLCVSAALDAVKQNVSIPWQVSSLQNPSTEVPDSSGESDRSEQLPWPRILSLDNFKKALREISPSESVMHGSVAELKKWNGIFGEGGRDHKRKLWGAGKFGFTNTVLPKR